MTRVLLTTDRQVQFEDVQFAYATNFEGRKERYNREGERYFNIKIQDPNEAAMLADMGFNIKFVDSKKVNEKRVLDGRDPLSPDQLEDYWFFKVPVYTMYSVPVIQIRDKDYIPDLDEDVDPDSVVFLPVELFGSVDTMEMDNVDIIITYRRPHEDGKYLRPQLKTMYIDVISTPLERKHRR